MGVNNPEFSIIIPVYNVAPYLRECLDSVLAKEDRRRRRAKANAEEDRRRRRKIGEQRRIDFYV